ncbi:hypothetical protein HD554DRAFT_2167288 [Boletus coccyginus]|nr:hypothetical protein HD554DRAFT_2167288 [Boletus coccyginus]
MLSFTIVCVLVNVLMGYIPSSLPFHSIFDLKPVFQGSPVLPQHTSFPPSSPDNAHIILISSDPIPLVEQLAAVELTVAIPAALSSSPAPLLERVKSIISGDIVNGDVGGYCSSK